jgi:phosphoribosyl-AMP cyclohydrolase
MRRPRAGRLPGRTPARPTAILDFCARLSLSDELSPFAPRGSTDEIEEGRAFAPKFDADGLVICVATDARSGEVLMVAHMNAQALRQTIATGEAWYFSRSRRALWRKGETSGHAQRVVEMRIDCDQDAVWIKVEQEGAGACHTGRRSCFYRAVPLGKAGAVMLEFRDGERTFDPNAVYGKKK